MATSIAELFVRVTGDVSDAVTGLTNVDQKINGTSEAMTRAAPAGLALAGAATAVGAAFLTSVTQAADFEKQINGIKAVMSPDEVNTFGVAVRDLALALGKDTVFTSGQAASAIEAMIKAGVPLPAILSGAAKSALDLASATGTDVTKSAELASTAMNTFHLSAAELPGVMNTVANVSNATATSVDGLRLGLSDVGSVANQFGLTFRDTALTLGVFANNGLTAQTAGTAMKTMLIGLIPDTKAQKDAFAALGLTTADGGNAFFDATGKMKPMSQVAEILKNALAGMTDQQKASTLQLLFGTQGMQAAAIVAAEGAAGFDKVSAEMDKMGGTAVAAAQRNSGLTGSMNQLGGSFEAIQIKIGSLFLPILTKVVDGVTALLNGFLTLDPGIQTVIVAVVGIAGVAAALLAGFILLTPVVTAVGAAFGIIAGAAAAVALPIAALIAVGALLYQAWQTNFGGIRDVTQQVWDALQPAFVNIQNFLGQVKDALAPVFAGLGAAIAPLLPILSDLVGKWLAQLPGAVRAVGDQFNTLGSWIRFAYDKIVELINTPQAQAFFAGLRAVADALGPPLNAAATAIGNILGTLGRVAGIVAGLGDPWAPFVNGAWEVGTRIGQAFGNFLGFIGQALGGIPNIISGLGDLWGPFITSAWEIGTHIGEAFGNFLGFIGTAIGGIPEIISKLGDLWEPFITSAWNIGTDLGNAFANFLGFIGTALYGIPQMIVDLGDLWEPFITSAWNIGTHIGDAFGNFLGFIGQALGGIPELISGLGDLWAPFITSAWNIGTGISDAFANFLKFIRDSISGIPTWISGIDIFGPIIEQAKALFQGISTAIEPIRKLLADTFGDFWKWLTGGGTLQPPPPPTGGGGGGGGGGTTISSLTINIQTGTLPGNTDGQALAQTIVDAILASSRRVSPPPPLLIG